MSPLDPLWIFFVLSSLQPVVQRCLLAQPEGGRRPLGGRLGPAVR